MLGATEHRSRVERGQIEHVDLEMGLREQLAPTTSPPSSPLRERPGARG